MMRLLTPARAYREDLANAPGRETFGPADGLWILMTQAIEHCAAAPRDSRAAALASLHRLLLDACEAHEAGAHEAGAQGTGTLATALSGVPAIRQLATALERLPEPTAPEPSVAEPSVPEPGAPEPGAPEPGADDVIAAACLQVIEVMTDNGANHLSLAALGQVRRLFPEVSPRLAARLLAHQGRIARQVGDLDSALSCFETILSLAGDTGDTEIEARGLYGAAGISLMRGNHPLARARYETALRLAIDAGSEELIGLAHRGLMVIHGSAGRLDAALMHAGEALRRSPHSATSYAELLGNIAAVCSAGGHYAAALTAYTVAARTGSALRVRLASLGGAAFAAAQLNDRATLDRVSREVEAALTQGAPPHESAQAYVELAKAYRLQGDGRATGYAEAARTLAARHECFEIVFEADQILAEPVRPQPSAVGAGAPQPVSDASRAVLAEISALEHLPRARTALTTG